MNTLIWRDLVLLMLLCIFTSGAIAQDDKNKRPPEIDSSEILKQRPVNDRDGIIPEDITRDKSVFIFPQKKPRRYRFVGRTSSIKSPPSSGAPKAKLKLPAMPSPTVQREQVGVTFWRMRPKRPDETYVETFRILVNGVYENWTAERVGSQTRFKLGDLVRFTIESSRSGYLYIVNREMHQDGSFGDPSLIFPTSRIYGGDNRVSAGSLIELPATNDNPPYLRVNTTNANYAGEEMLVIVTSERLALEIGSTPLRLTRTQVDGWIDSWQSDVEIYDAVDGEGIGLTKIEAGAGGSSSRELTQGEPLPQTIFKITTRDHQPVIFPVRMLVVK
jgi:hypothetical protein